MFLRVSLFYVLTWFFLIFLGGIQQATGLLPPEIGLAQWGPGVAALLMLVIFRKDGHKITFFSKDTPRLRYLYAVFIPVGVSLIIFLIWSLMSSEPAADSPTYGSLLPLVLWMPFGALGEELGWRGYLHKQLAGRTRLRGLWLYPESATSFWSRIAKLAIQYRLRETKAPSIRRRLFR